MTTSNWRIVGSTAPAVFGGKDWAILPTNRAPPLLIQMKREEELSQKALRTQTVSRRNTMLYMAVSVLGVSAEPAEARVGRVENKRKAMEKLQRLREKALPSEKEKNIATPSLPNRRQNAIKPLVEVSLILTQ
ncbi:uncharacterized protein LOC110813439 [Carica papaya]|uniref:uncharacterized protein LOC110813439 n=1 Tax=Carica papaya TaxID=3649 RepID=UPI000B8D0EC2|nr:uncharacterized protein LOC110813439 [Carica papaya]